MKKKISSIKHWFLTEGKLKATKVNEKEYYGSVLKEVEKYSFRK